MSATGSTVDLQSRLVSILDYVESSARAATDFAVDQATDVAMQIIYWNMAKHSFWALFIAIAASGLFYLGARMRKFGKGYKKEYYSDSDGEVATFFGWGSQIGSVIAGTAGILANVAIVVKLIVAPKLFLIEYVAALIKSSQM